MKTLGKQMRLTSLLLGLLFLLQSCSVYNRQSVSLEDAFKSDEKVKIQNSIDETLVFKKVVKNGEEYFGLKRSKGVLIQVPLKENYINKIYLYNSTLSALTIVMPLILTIVGIRVSQAYNDLP